MSNKSNFSWQLPRRYPFKCKHLHHLVYFGASNFVAGDGPYCDHCLLLRNRKIQFLNKSAEFENATA